MKTIAAILIALALFAVCLPAAAQENAPEPPVAVEEAAPAPPGPPPAVAEPPTPPAAPDQPVAPPPAPAPPAPKPNAVIRPTTPGGPPALMNRAREVVVGPTDSKNNPRRVRGKVTVVAVPPGTAAVASVEIFFNAALIGQTSAKPYKVDFNTDTVSPGVHTFKAVGLDANGKQVWTASTAVEVSGANGAPPPTPIKTMSPPGKPTGPQPPLTPNAKKPGTGTIAPAVPKPAPSIPQGSATLGKTYANAKHNFLVRYPTGWTVKDQSAAMKPKKSGNVWMAFTPSAKTPSLAVNVRRMRVDSKTTADVFAKYNPYVNSWERKTVLGSQAFTTTSTVAPKKVIHRLILIKNGYAWMLNCVDASGDSPDNSQKLFDSVVGSLVVKGG